MNTAGPDKPIPGTGYALRTVIVAEDLDVLHGPLAGRAQLPLWLDASARRTYDLTDPHERALLYEVVLLEAGRPQDLSDWLDGEELVRLWPDLYLPRVVRAAWQAKHRRLEQAGTGPNVPPL